MNEINFKEIIKVKGISLLEVARALGMSNQNLGQQLSRNPSFMLILKISNVTGIPLDEFACKKSVKGNMKCPHCGKDIEVTLS